MSKARQFIKDYTRSCSNIEYTQGVYTPSYHPWLTPEQALAAVEIAREEVIDEVCAYLRDNIDPQLTIYHEQTWCKRDEFINKLKKVMEDRK